MQIVQVFGIKGSATTRAAERFFKERGSKIQFVDLNQKAMARGEMQRFLEKYGLAGLLDTDGKSYLDAGLKYLKLSEPELLSRIENEPKLLRLPLVRAAQLVSIGQDEESWKKMLEQTQKADSQRRSG